MEENNKAVQPKKKEGFKSNFGAIMSVIGFTVGLGSLWGTPMFIAQSGGGLAIIMIVGLSALIAIPLTIIELGLGRKTRTTIIVGMESLVGKGSFFNAMGYIGSLAGFLLASTFVILNGAVLAYFIMGVMGKLSNQTVETHQAIYSGLFANTPVMILLIAIISCAYLVVNSFNVQAGLEKVCKFMVPSLLAMLILMGIWNIVQPGGLKGLIWFFTPNWSVFSLDLLGSAMWTVFLLAPVGYSFGWAFGSYLPGEGAEGDLPTTSTIVVLSDCTVGICVGLSIFPAMFASGIDPMSLATLSFFGGIPLTFDTIPGGRFLVCVFFVLAFFALFTTGIGLTEGPVASLKDKFGWSRKKSAIIVNVAELVVSAITVLSVGAGQTFNGMDLMTYIQYFIMLQLVPIGGFFLLMYLYKKWKFNQFMLDVNQGATAYRVTNLWKVLYYFVVPAIALYTFYFGATCLYPFLAG